MLQARRQRVARRREVWALRWADSGQYAWAIDAANEAVAVRRPLADQHPAAMARALAVRSMCLHVRGRTAEAARDVDECLAFWYRADGSASGVDLAVVASLLGRAGRVAEAVPLAERLLADARRRAKPRSPTPTLVYGELMLRHGRPEQAVAALRDAHAAAAWWSNARLRASAMLFEALAAAGHIEELHYHAERDLALFAGNAWGSVPGRRLYINVLELLERHDVGVGRLPPLAVTIAKQRRKLLRQQRRWWVAVAAFGVLTGRRREVPSRPRASGPTDATRAAARAHAARAEADVEQYRESGDARELSLAWGTLAQARWQAGGPRSAALEAQRTALAETRRWAADDSDEARAALVVQLRRFAYFAGIIGLRTDAQMARAEADALDRADR